jgi:hypothetical protein
MAQVHVPDEAGLLERLEVAVDRGDVQAARDLLRGERPRSRVERLEQQPPRRREPHPALAQHAVRRLQVGRLDERGVAVSATHANCE